jgi:hypothetical protein
VKLERSTGEWIGDVWKTIIHLKSKYKDCLNITVLETDYGLGYITVNLEIKDFSSDEQIIISRQIHL